PDAAAAGEDQGRPTKGYYGLQETLRPVPQDPRRGRRGRAGHHEQRPLDVRAVALERVRPEPGDRGGLPGGDGRDGGGPVADGPAGGGQRSAGGAEGAGRQTGGG